MNIVKKRCESLHLRRFLPYIYYSSNVRAVLGKTALVKNEAFYLMENREDGTIWQLIH